MTDRDDVTLDELYREVVLDHHRQPRGRAPLARVDATARGFNPVCGDEVQLEVAMDGDRIEAVRVDGRGCAICTASGSIMAEMLPGETAVQACRQAEAFRTVMRGGEPDGEVDLGDLEALEGVKRFPVRVKCAMLPWVTLKDALRAWSDGDAAQLCTTEEEHRA